MDALVVLIVLPALGLGAAGGYLAQSFLNKRGLVTAAQKSQGIIQGAEEQKKRILLEAQEEALKHRTSEERDLRERRSELRRQERGLSNRKEQLERRSEGLEKRERSVNERDRELDGLRRELEDFVRKSRNNWRPYLACPAQKLGNSCSSVPKERYSTK
jgi:ribonuclease Y